MKKKQAITWVPIDVELTEERGRLFRLACRCGRFAPSIFVPLSRAVRALDRSIFRLRGERGAEAVLPSEAPPPPEAPKVKPRPAAKIPRRRRARGR